MLDLSSLAAVGLLHSIQRWSFELGVVALMATTAFYLAYFWKAKPARQYARATSEIEAILNTTLSDQVSSRLHLLSQKYGQLSATQVLIATSRPRLVAHLANTLAQESAARDESVRKDRQDELLAAFDAVLKKCFDRIKTLKANSPAIKVDKLLTAALASVQQQKATLQTVWQERHDKLTWWGRMNHEEPNLKVVDKKISDIVAAQRRLQTSGDLAKTHKFFADLEARSQQRIITSRTTALLSVPQSHNEQYDSSRIAQHSLLLAAMSVPVSVWSDITQAGNVYQTLREVNGNYAEMSDLDIWMTTLMLPSESLAGLASLTKGAYFEKLVEADTGGIRFEHFNHPDTDIVIDGTAYQIKATDSADYIGTVDENIPVIATSEVADATRAIDGGHTNEDMEGAVDLALGSSIVDISDTAVDSVLTGLGGLGLLATIKGIGHAADRYKQNGDVVLAVADGLEVAVVSTAKATVDALELGHKALTSAPSRFVGRMVLKVGSGLVKAVDRKLEGK